MTLTEAPFVAKLVARVEQYGVVCHAWVLRDNHYQETPMLDASVERIICRGYTMKGLAQLSSERKRARASPV